MRAARGIAVLGARIIQGALCPVVIWPVVLKPVVLKPGVLKPGEKARRASIIPSTDDLNTWRSGGV